MAHAWLVGTAGDAEATIKELVTYGAPRDFLDQFAEDQADTLYANCQVATDTIIGWFGDAIRTPITAWGSDVRARTAHVVIYLLKSVVGMASLEAAAGEDNIRARYLDAEEWARSVGKGEIVAQGMVDSGDADGAPLLAAYPFGDSPRGW